MEEGQQIQSGLGVDQSSVSGRQSSLRNVCARQVAVNFMPSRQLPYNTLRHRRHNSENNGLLDETDNAEGDEDDIGNEDQEDNEDRRAAFIVKELEQQHQLMEDSPLSEELRRAALRDLPQGLTMKRTVRAKLSASVSLRSRRRPISLLRRTKYRISFAWKRSKERIRDAMFSVELWYEAIRNIEGQFGSAVGSYFRMLRRLFALNLALSVFLLAFVVIPQGVLDAAKYPDDTADHREKGFLHRVRMTYNYVINTMMYYGHYSEASETVPYNMTFAYFFTMITLYLVFFAVLCYRTAYSYRRNFIEAAGGLSHVFANKVFCGWDFGIMSSHAAELNARSIYNELKELLSEQNKKKTDLTFLTRLGQTLTNVTMSALVLSAIGGLLFALWALLENFAHWEVSVSALLILLVSVCPLVFDLVGRSTFEHHLSHLMESDEVIEDVVQADLEWALCRDDRCWITPLGAWRQIFDCLEYYTPRTALYVTLGRTWLLDVTILMLLFVFWSRSGLECWETRFGQETYRLVMLDAVVSIIVLPGIEIFRALLYKFRPTGSPPEFNIAYNSLTLIYNQTVLWFGMLFSPPLALAVTIKLLFLFYIKRECAMRACQPARKVWRAAQTQTVLFMLITLSLFTTLFGIGSVFLRMESKQCGPFRSYSHVFAVLGKGVLRLDEREQLRIVLSYLYRPGVLAFAVLLLSVLVYYCRARARAQQAMVQILRHMLLLQAKDKDFLLTAISKVSNGEWLYSPRATGEGADSHTFRYLREVRKPSNSSFHFEGSRLSRTLADRPRSDLRPTSAHVDQSHNDGDTDSSFSWQGSVTDVHNSTQN